ncbi:MAG: cytochrome c [Candidatus Marinimicrobia bacterium]|nr:cytochrome c [Candidatus Neomarinimicrobiota bacterium]
MLIGCGKNDKTTTDEQGGSPAGGDGLSQTQLTHGIGPIQPFNLEPLDDARAAAGKEIFEVKCIACHKIDERLVGPPLSGVTERRSPGFIMNMILNPDQMVKQHPEVKAMLAQYYVPMTFQNVTEEDARSILEYLRTLKSKDLTKGE